MVTREKKKKSIDMSRQRIRNIIQDFRVEKVNQFNNEQRSGQKSQQKFDKQRFSVQPNKKFINTNQQLPQLK